MSSIMDAGMDLNALKDRLKIEKKYKNNWTKTPGRKHRVDENAVFPEIGYKCVRQLKFQLW